MGDNGSAGKLVGIGADPTARGVGARLLAALAEHGGEYLLLLEGDATIRYASAGVADLIGRPAERLVSRRLMDVVSLPDEPMLRRRIERLGPGEPLVDQHLALLRPDGTTLELLGTRIDLTGDPETCGILWSLRQISNTGAEVERARVFAAGSSDVPVVVSADGVVSYVGPSVRTAFGMPPARILGHRAVDAVHPADRDLLERVLSAALDSEPGAMVRFRIRNGEGQWRWVETILDNHLGNPAIAGVVGNLRDVTDQQMATEALAASERRYRRLLETTAEAVVVLDDQWRVTFANATAYALVGVGASRVTGRSLLDFVVAERRGQFERHLADAHEAGPQRFETAVARRDGRRIDVLASASAFPDDVGTAFGGTLLMLVDITRRKRVESELSRMVLTDPLTGLPNRALLLDRVEQALVRHDHTTERTAVLVVDVDSFRLWNETLGHSGADRLLMAVATRLSGAVRPGDTVGRLADDEFVVLAPDAGALVAARMAEGIIEAVAAPWLNHERRVDMTASVGIALTPAPDNDTLVARAQTARYRARQAGGNRFEVYDESRQAPARIRLGLVSELRHAVRAGQLRVFYQPTVRLDGVLTSMEALVRWQHPTRGLLPPSEFIEVAEETGIIGEIGTFVLDQACSDLSRWQVPYRYRNLRMAVNLSARQLCGPGVADWVASTTAHHAVDPTTLALEITESVLLEDAAEAVADNLDALSRLGCTLAVDDFGTGYSSLLYLKRFPIGALKLDRSFVAGLGERAEDTIIVRALIDLAHELGLIAVAEGVETIRQATLLEQLDCDFAQGYLWARPMAAADLDACFAAAGTERVRFTPSRPTVVRGGA